MSLSPVTLRRIRELSGTRVFIETGTHLGGGVTAALAAGYSEVHSIELSEKYWAEAKRRVGANAGVYLHRGDSGDVLPLVLLRFEEPVTIFLDSHTVPGLEESAISLDPTHPHCPLLRELNAILIHDHPDVIIVDDIDECGTKVFDGISERQVIGTILRINPSYIFERIHGARPDSILVAFIPKPNPNQL